MCKTMSSTSDKSRISEGLGRFVGICASVCGVLFASASAVAQCDDWRVGPLFDLPGVNGRVNAAITWDPDGGGPLPAQLVIAGLFTEASGTAVNYIARWDGSAWQPFISPTGDIGMSAEVYDIIALPPNFGSFPGQLIATGEFNFAGGVLTRGFARWDGTTWHPVANADGFIRAMTIWDPDGPGPQPPELVVGGFFSEMGTVSASNIAAWDGTNWRSLGDGFESPSWVYALTTWDPDGAGPLPAQLIAAGTFHTRGSTVVNGIARWDGSAWQPLGNGLTGPNCSCVVFGLGVIPPGNGAFAGQLVAAGAGLTAPNSSEIARWDG